MRYALNVAPVNGWQAHFGSSQAAMALSGSGGADFATLGAGTAGMHLTSQGNAGFAVSGSGFANMTRYAVAAPQTHEAQFGAGDASMTMEAAHGLPHPIVRLGSFSAAHKSRAIEAAPETRILRGS